MACVVLKVTNDDTKGGQPDHSAFPSTGPCPWGLDWYGLQSPILHRAIAAESSVVGYHSPCISSRRSQ